MPYPTWPTGIQSPYAQGSPTYTPNDTYLRTPTDSGMSKVRRKYTGISEKLAFTLELPYSQRTTFWNWFDNTIKEVLPFDWVDLRTGNVQAYRFMKRPTETWVAGDTGAGMWLLTIELETVY